MEINKILSYLKAERNRIDQAIGALEGLDAASRHRRGRPPKSQVSQPAPRKRKMSAASRKRISAAMKQRWIQWKGKSASKKVTSSAKNSTGRRPMSPAMRKKLSAMMKARWAARKKGS
jgi:hypothetical protein